MNDLISRSELLNYMENNEISQYAEELNNGNDNYSSTELYNYVKKMPTAYLINKVVDVAEQYNNGWIPCSERLPDTDSYILLSFSNFSIPLFGRYEIDEDGGGAFCIGDESETCLSQDMFVNAWQQLPEPYKESEEE